MCWIYTDTHKIKSSPSVHFHISVNLLFSFTELSQCETVAMQGECYPISAGLLTSFPATAPCSSSPLIPASPLHFLWGCLRTRRTQCPDVCTRYPSSLLLFLLSFPHFLFCSPASLLTCLLLSALCLSLLFTSTSFPSLMSFLFAAF